MTKIKQLFLLTFGLLIFISSCNSNGQAQKIDNIELVQNFKPGIKYQYEVQRGKIDSRQPGSENIKSATDVLFCVLSEKKDTKECSWKYGSTKVIGISPDQIDEQTKKFMNVHQGIEVKFTIDNKGSVQEITNFEECKKYIESAFKAIYENASNKLTPEQYIKMMDALKSSYETPEMLVSTYCPELTIFFTMFGETIKSDSIYLSKSELPNPFGGRSFPTNVTTKVDNMKDNIASISVKQTIPPDDLNSIIRETFIELSKLSEKPFNEKEIPKMNMTTTSIFNYDFKKKILNDVYSEKLIEADGIKQNQTLKVILKN